MGEYTGGVSKSCSPSNAYLGDYVDLFKIIATKDDVRLAHLQPDGTYKPESGAPLWALCAGHETDWVEGGRKIRAALEFLALCEEDPEVVAALTDLAYNSEGHATEAVELLEEYLAECAAEIEEDEDTGLLDLVTSPAAFARRMLDLGLEPSEAEEALIDLGFERADDEGSHLCLWDNDADSWTETTLSRLWTHPSWPTGTVIYDESTHEPSWVLATWDDAAEGDEPFGYVHDHWDGDALVQVRVLPFSRNRS